MMDCDTNDNMRCAEYRSFLGDFRATSVPVGAPALLASNQRSEFLLVLKALEGTSSGFPSLVLLGDFRSLLPNLASLCESAVLLSHQLMIINNSIFYPISAPRLIIAFSLTARPWSSLSWPPLCIDKLECRSTINRSVLSLLCKMICMLAIQLGIRDMITG